MSCISRALAAIVMTIMPLAAMGGTAAAQAPKPAPKPAAPSTAAPASAAAGPVIVIETVKGTIELETYPKDAPKTVEHIVALVKRNFYNGLRVHRVVPGFVVQFGDPQTRDMTKRQQWGTGGSGRSVGVAEIKRPHTAGAVAMAHAGDPAKADAQMYITLSPQPSLNKGYAVFGQVTSGMDVVQKLAEGDVIRRATVKP